ncbi:MAG: hypothetical protein IPM22_01310 [Betaproteobacteria bacterium]|nr:hypothetical protein [Betaproteobacteria bacterium]MCC7217681.1 hypothetical protein [Burkholderiales bacterium]
MGKIVFWIVVVFVVLFALRLWNSAKARRREAGEAGTAPDPAAPQAMVRCAQCGVFLPKADALPAPGGYRCSDPKCAQAPH